MSRPRAESVVSEGVSEFEHRCQVGRRTTARSAFRGRRASEGTRTSAGDRPEQRADSVHRTPSSYPRPIGAKTTRVSPGRRDLLTSWGGGGVEGCSSPARTTMDRVRNGRGLMVTLLADSTLLLASTLFARCILMCGKCLRYFITKLRKC